MKTKLNLLPVGIFLAALSAGFAQSTLQFSATTYTVAESAGTVTLTVQRLNNTDTVMSVPGGAEHPRLQNNINEIHECGR